MNTAVTVAAPTLDDPAELRLANAIAAMFADTEQRFSRFLHDSELSQLNRATEPITVSPEMMELLRTARQYVAQTGGVFDPTIGAALRAAGYDRSFSPGALDRASPVTPRVHGDFAELVLDEHACRVLRPPHLYVDLGGFLKGRTVDRAAAIAPPLAMVDAGGDAVLRGAGVDHRGWLVDIEDPTDPDRSLLTLRLRDRAVATSAANRRRWRAGKGTAHHLIDPRTGTPAVSDLVQVTAIAPTAERADVLAKVAFILGANDGARLLGGPDLGGVLIARDGSVRIVGDLEVEDA
ncbi:MAG TPA: FAD:protein FMN transferase [Kofleriaceae bacterium]|nr:FAD:protein FMN transferase [Kofleriaceae bacterium]